MIDVLFLKNVLDRVVVTVSVSGEKGGDADG